MSMGAIIIAAHNEEGVIGRTLSALAEAHGRGSLTIIVVCNGCDDRTAEIARRADVTVAILKEASKTAALREGDRIAGPGNRIYLDADVTLTSRAAMDVFQALADGAIAARPRHEFSTSRSGWIVRRWYDVRSSLPSISSALWGAGCYALSESGRGRFVEFPDIVSDDLFIHSHFRSDEIVIVDTDPVVVQAPRRTVDLLRILKRSYRTQSEVADSGRGLSDGQRSQLVDVVALVKRTPSSLPDALLYAGVIVTARVWAVLGRSRQRWERDRSSREA